MRPPSARATGGLDVGDDAAALHQVRVLLATGGYATPQTLDAWHFAWRGRTYRGTYATVALPDGRNALVNTLPLDAYLYGVLSKEVGASWAPSAQQAQAIVARTYALLKLRPEKAYDVTPGDADQNYGGIESETVEGRAAVDATAGAIVTYGGLPAHVAYSSCCGGRTADAGDVWDTPYPYLRSVVDPNCARTPDFTWQANVSLAVVENALGKQLASCGAVRSVMLRADDPAARPRAIAFVGKSSTLETPVSQFRTSVSPALVRSTYIRNAVLAPDANAISLAGTGRGHGVGLCQWGTRVLGESGMTAENIVAFYFREFPSDADDARDVALLATDAYRYDLPPQLIANVPADPPESARLMVLRDRTLDHTTFADFPSLLRAGDVLVINETRVIRARLHGRREPGGGRAELLLLRPARGGAFEYGAREWAVLAKPGRKLDVGARVAFGNEGRATVRAVRDDGIRIVEIETTFGLENLLERHGEMPLPPYVGPGPSARDARYQTIFARVPGSVAAPTASLHFTTESLAEIRARGVTVVPLVLDVGLGTFKPIQTPHISDHVMHAERYDIPAATAHAVNVAKDEGRRVVVAGTTALRALEAAAASSGRVVAGANVTALFIAPGFRFAVADALLTNFHLPGSTLLVLIAAFAGYERAMNAYAQAIARSYRFHSFGDAMFVEDRARL